MRALMVLGVVAGVSSLAPAARAQVPPPAGHAPPNPGYAPPPPGYGYPPPGYGQLRMPAPLSPGHHTHDGFYLRLDFGAAYTSMSVNDPLDGKVTLAGVGASLGIAAGWAVQRNVILFGRAMIAGASGPNLEINGRSMGESTSDTDLYSFGGGAAYYFEGSNVHVAGSLLASQVAITNTITDQQHETHFGLGVEGLIGKEWWVSENWGLGVALQLLYASMTDKSITGTNAKWTAGGGALLFSATYN